MMQMEQVLALKGGNYSSLKDENQLIIRVFID